VGLCFLACSGGDSAPPPEAEPSGDPSEDAATDEWIQPAGTELRLSIDGRAEPMGAKAQLNVEEGVRTVHLSITGVDGANDLVILDLDFDGIESSLGPHQGDVGLPYTGVYTVSASLEGRPYHSQAGHIELSLGADGSIEGTFGVDLAEDPQGLDQRLELLPLDQVRGLSGQFSGQWVLRCQSRLPGHRSLILGGDYCESLEF
jgi:hypothetical protein